MQKIPLNKGGVYMPKFMRYFLFGFVFVLGMSVGTYLGIGKNKAVYEENNSSKNIVPVQDVVIRNTQSEKTPEPKVIETIVEETKISPYAKLIIEKKFTKCGHTTVEVIDVPNELINMTEKEIMKKYENWEVRSFNSKEVSLYREISANCNDHFVLKDKDGFLAIYTNVTDDKMNLKEVTDIDVSSLPSGDMENLKRGIFIYGQDELSSILEDFNS